MKQCPVLPADIRAIRWKSVQETAPFAKREKTVEMTRRLAFVPFWHLLAFVLLVAVPLSCSVADRRAQRTRNSHQKEVGEVADSELLYVTLNFDMLRRVVVIYADSLNKQSAPYNSIKVSVQEMKYLNALIRHVFLYVAQTGDPRVSDTFVVHLHVSPPYQKYEGNVLPASFVKNLIMELDCADSPMTPASRAKLTTVLTERYEVLRKE